MRRSSIKVLVFLPVIYFATMISSATEVPDDFVLLGENGEEEEEEDSLPFLQGPVEEPAVLALASIPEQPAADTSDEAPSPVPDIALQHQQDAHWFLSAKTKLGALCTLCAFAGSCMAALYFMEPPHQASYQRPVKAYPKPAPSFLPTLKETSSTKPEFRPVLQKDPTGLIRCTLPSKAPEPLSQYADAWSSPRIKALRGDEAQLFETLWDLERSISKPGLGFWMTESKMVAILKWALKRHHHRYSFHFDFSKSLVVIIHINSGTVAESQYWHGPAVKPLSRIEIPALPEDVLESFEFALNYIHS